MDLLMRLSLRALNRLPMVRPRITPRFADPYTTVVTAGDGHNPNACIPLRPTDHSPASASPDDRSVAADDPQAFRSPADTEASSRPLSGEALKTAKEFSEPALMVNESAVHRPLLPPEPSSRPQFEEGRIPSIREPSGAVNLNAEGAPGNPLIASTSEARAPFIRPSGIDTVFFDSTSGSEAPQTQNRHDRPPETLPEAPLSSAFPGTPASPTMLSTEAVRSQGLIPAAVHTQKDETGRTRDHHDAIGELPESRERISQYEPMVRSRHSSRLAPGEPVIQVSIGRIEVRAVTSSTARPAQRRPVMTLDHYLQQRAVNKG
jgi:hypothetical protein